MRTLIRTTVTVLVTLGVAAGVGAGGLDMPPGKWWKNPQLIDRIGLGEEQQEAIAGLVYEHAQRMIDLHADVRHQELRLRDMVQQAEIDASAVRAAFGDLQQARRALERERFELLLQVRQTVSPEQWRELQHMRSERQSEARRPGARRAPGDERRYRRPRR